MIAQKYSTLIDAMSAAPPHRRFVTMWRDEDDVETITFGEFLHAARVQAADFLARGLKPGDTVVLVMPQGVSLMVAFAGAVLIGAVPAIMAYPNFKVEPAKYRYGLAGVSRNLKARLVLLDEMFPDELLSHVSIEGGAAVVRTAARAECVTSPDLPTTKIDGNNTAFIQHSAGTTGLQKGVALSHAAVLKQLEHLQTALLLNDQDRIYSWLPLYHDMGLIACFMLPLVYHIPVVMQSPTEWVIQPGTMLSLISEFRCTLAWTPNFALQFLARRVPESDRLGFDLSSLRMLINCSEPVRAQSIAEFRAAYLPCGLRPNALQASYALAENVFALTQSGMDGSGGPLSIWVDADRLSSEHVAERTPEAQPGSICLVSSGRSLPGNHFRILDEEGVERPDGYVGEIVMHSDCLFQGYYNRPDLTTKALKDGWYWSGDLGFRLDGELFVIGRKSDLIIVAGKNLYPQDIEDIACANPAIHDGRAVAFGLFNPALGTEEIIVVAEVEDERQLEERLSIERSIRAAVTAELGVAVRAVYLRPPKWIVKSTAGKPARSTTRQKLLSEQPELSKTYE